MIRCPYSAATPSCFNVYVNGISNQGSETVATCRWLARTRCTKVDPARGRESRKIGHGDGGTWREVGVTAQP